MKRTDKRGRRERHTLTVDLTQYGVSLLNEVVDRLSTPTWSAAMTWRGKVTRGRAIRIALQALLFGLNGVHDPAAKAVRDTP